MGARRSIGEVQLNFLGHTTKHATRELSLRTPVQTALCSRPGGVREYLANKFKRTENLPSFHLVAADVSKCVEIAPTTTAISCFPQYNYNPNLSCAVPRSAPPTSTTTLQKQRPTCEAEVAWRTEIARCPVAAVHARISSVTDRRLTVGGRGRGTPVAVVPSFARASRCVQSGFIAIPTLNEIRFIVQTYNHS